MNQKHIQAKQSGINSWLGERRMRIKQTIGVSQNQLELTKRILKIREKINRIPDNITVAICMDDVHIYYLFRFTKIKEKNIIGFIDEIENKYIYNSFDDYEKYEVLSFEDSEWRRADCVLIADLSLGDNSLKKKIEAYGNVGTICNLYETEDVIPFFCIPESMTQWSESLLNEPAKAILTERCSIPSEYWFSMIEKIDKINHILERCSNGRICVYCVGGHTKKLFEYTDIKYKNVVAFADRREKSFQGMIVRDVTVDNFKDIDFVVISSFQYQAEIVKYLVSIGLQDKIIKLYDMSDEVPFYEVSNICSPDRLSTYAQSENGLSMADLYACVEWSSGSLSKNSEYLVTYNLLKNQIIDKCVLHNKAEHEVIAEKNYGNANRQTAIILQGPILYEDDFTYRTICYYSILFPESKIILSTWEDEKEQLGFERFYKLPIEIVLSEPPKEKGVLNINYQVKSTYMGILKAKELGYEYTIKTRTDFRLYADDCLSYLYTLMEMFPVKGKVHKRIAILPPFLDVAYYIPDYILFGSTEDMLSFWDASVLYPNNTKGLNPEMLLFTRYIKILDSYVEDPLEHLGDYIDMLCTEFIVTDPSVYKYYWKKYSYEGSILYQESGNILTASDWFRRQLIIGGR